jgi:hypothetical protein
LLVATKWQNESVTGRLNAYRLDRRDSGTVEKMVDD